MTWIVSAIEFLGPTGTAIAGSSILNAVTGSNQAGAAERGAQMQADAAARAAALQEKQYADLEPYRKSGQLGLTKIEEMLPYFTREVTAEDLRRMPGFEFGLNQGVGATGQAMNVGGGGSNVDLARRKFAIDYATNVGMPQYISQRTGIYNTLANIAGIGQKSQEQSGNIASNIGQLGVGGASALAGGQIGAANAYANLGSNVGNNLMLSQLISPQGGGGITPGGVTTMNPELANSYFGSIKT
jgi:hypothetical protein